jgi:dTDP-4-amino-4,6-dideoxygalactose transaminase
MIRQADLVAQHAPLRAEIESAIREVLISGEFVLGCQVAAFEAEFAEYSGVTHGIGVNSGTSALHLALLGAGVGPGDEVIAPAFSFAATIAAIGYTGARPVLVDITPDTFTIDPARIEAAITARSRVIIPVHLYGHPADMDPILDIAARHGLAVIEDAAQAHGAEYRGRRVGSLGDAGCFSFYPSKNLGACGEAGMVLTSRPDLAAAVRSLRNWGQLDQLRHPVRGFNCRMDSIQGAVLRVKLRHLEEWTETRRSHARRYDEVLQSGKIRAPVAKYWARHVYHQYVIRTRARDSVRAALASQGVEARIHYPVALHMLDAWADLGHRPSDFSEAEAAAAEVLSIPVHPELATDDLARVEAALESVGSGFPEHGE